MEGKIDRQKCSVRLNLYSCKCTEKKWCNSHVEWSTWPTKARISYDAHGESSIHTEMLLPHIATTINSWHISTHFRLYRDDQVCAYMYACERTGRLNECCVLNSRCNVSYAVLVLEYALWMSIVVNKRFWQYIVENESEKCEKEKKNITRMNASHWEHMTILFKC